MLDYVAGSGICITRANVKAYNKAHEISASPEQIVAAFKPVLYKGGSDSDKYIKRLLARASKVCHPPIREEVEWTKNGEAIKKKHLGRGR